MHFTPYSYQSRAIDFVLRTPCCLLFLDMGLGKSVITLTAISRLIDDLEVGRTLVVAPKSVAEATWSAEVDKWDHLRGLRVSCIIGDRSQRLCALAAEADIYVISRDNLAWLVKSCSRELCKFDTLVLDELTSFKNPKAQRFKAIRAIRPHFRRIIGLTGTPAPNGYLDLWAQVFCIDGGQRLGVTVTRYRDRYFVIDNPYVTWPSYRLAPGAQSTIEDKIADISLSMRASDYLTLPDRIPITIPVPLTPALLNRYHTFERDQVLQFLDDIKDHQHQELRIAFLQRRITYDEYASKAKALGIPDSEIWKSDVTPVEAVVPEGSPEGKSTSPSPAIYAASAAALASKLAQFANGAIYDEYHLARHVHDLKIDALRDIIEAAASPVLVFYAFRHDATRIAEALHKDYRVRAYSSAEDLADWNAGRIDVLLAHPASTAYGLNMQQGGHTIVWFGLTWNLEHYQQANARLHRQGQSQPVRIYHLVAKDTIDERAITALSSKASTQNHLLNAIKELTSKYQ